MACLFLILVGLVSILVTMSRYQAIDNQASATKNRKKEKKQTSAFESNDKQVPKSRLDSLWDRMTSGIVGNAVFVIVIAIVIFIIKLKGYVDPFIDKIIH